MLIIPFFPNTKDNLHCVQACLKSVLKFYFPKQNYSFKYLDKVTKHKKGKWTWDIAMMLFLARLNFEVIYVANFDFKKFAVFGEKYLQSIWSNKVYKVQKKFSDFPQEQKLAKLLIKNKKIKLIKSTPTVKDLKTLFQKEFLLLVAINPYVLTRKKGYASHLVIVTNITKKTITFHDPGLPFQKNKKVLLSVFNKSLDGTLIGIKLSD